MLWKSSYRWAIPIIVNAKPPCSYYGDSCLQLEHQIVSQLQTFVDHFIPRFIEIACADCEETISFAMISVLRIMQKYHLMIAQLLQSIFLSFCSCRGGLLDSVSEDKLDLVDAVVFDTAVNKKLRQVTLIYSRYLLERFVNSLSADLLFITIVLTSQAALVFFFDHTEGFDNVEDEDQAGVDKSQSQVSSAANKKKRFTSHTIRLLSL